MATLIFTAIAGLIAFLFWLKNAPNKNNDALKILIYMFFGASLMWSIDVFFELKELGLGYFEEQTSDVIIDDSLLGLTVIAFALGVYGIKLILPRLA
ncbi:MAG: hypothetical protein ACI4V7_04935 [Succinivibrionaceae bacterium]